MEDFEGLSDHFILRMYEFIRHEVHAEMSAGTVWWGSRPGNARSNFLSRSTAGVFTASQSFGPLAKRTRPIRSVPRTADNELHARLAQGRQI